MPKTETLDMSVRLNSSSAPQFVKLQTSSMTTSTRFYERLGAMPSDPSDPESVAELVVVAFGAFERYYVCWRNQAGQYRQDSYGLPDSLHQWLFPPDGGTRHFPTLQIIFGRGDEFFASDMDGKLENKDTDLREKIPRADSPVEKTERPILRRSRTLSLVRPSSDPVLNPFSPIMESPNRPAFPRSRKRPQSIAYAAGVYPLERMNPAKETTYSHSEHTAPKLSYANASVQTEPELTHSSLSLQDSESETLLESSSSSRSSVVDIATPTTAISPAPNPVVMGRMLDYFNAPKYQLGDALRSTYYHQPTYPEHGLYATWRSVLDRRRTV